MSFRLTGIATLLKRHGRNLTLLRDADTVYDTNTSETYQSVNGWNETTIELEYYEPLGQYIYVRTGGINLGEISREPATGQKLETVRMESAGAARYFVLVFRGPPFNPPTYIYINGVRSLLESNYHSGGITNVYYRDNSSEEQTTFKITIEEPQWQVRGYFYDSKEVNIYDTQVGEGNRRVVFYPIDLSGNPLPKPRIGDKVRGQSDVVSIYRVEEVMSNDKVLVYLCRVNE